ncbi:MAG: hypothetical protein ACREIY_04725 [Candidatus Rokuibacteriota bacterium]
MTRPREAHERIKAEITREKAAALGDAAADPEEGARLLGEYEDAHARARHARLALVIQREANGLRQHRVVDKQIPEPQRRAGGQRPSAP